MKEEKPMFFLRRRGKEGTYRAPDLIKVNSVVLQQCFPFFFTAWSRRVSDLFSFSNSTYREFREPDTFRFLKEKPVFIRDSSVIHSASDEFCAFAFRVSPYRKAMGVAPRGWKRVVVG